MLRITITAFMRYDACDLSITGRIPGAADQWQYPDAGDIQRLQPDHFITPPLGAFYME